MSAEWTPPAEVLDVAEAALIESAYRFQSRREMAAAVLVAARDLLEAEVEAADREIRIDELRRFADTRGVNVGDEDDEWWRGYRQAQRECLHDAVARADALDGRESREVS